MITLLSDLGLQDASVAIAKGILMQYDETSPIADITHSIQPFNNRQAAYQLGAAYSAFPPGSVHVLLFDIFAGGGNRLILSRHKAHYFLSADNKLLAATLRAQPEQAWLCAELKSQEGYIEWLQAAGNTIRQLQKYSPETMGLAPFSREAEQPPEPAYGDQSWLSLEALYVDRYENVVINFTKKQFDNLSHKGLRFRLQFSGFEEIAELSNHYSDVKDGYKLCRFNSNGYLEICINHGKAASLFGLWPGNQLNDIKIYTK